MTLDTMQAVVDELKRRGLDATLEYPGYIQVGKNTTYGDQNDTFDGAVMTDDFAEVIEELDSSIPCDSTDVQRIADWIATNHPPKVELASLEAK